MSSRKSPLVPEMKILTIRTETDGKIAYCQDERVITAAKWWTACSVAMEATTEELAVIMGCNKRTLEGWRQGRAVAARYRPGIASALAYHYGQYLQPWEAGKSPKRKGGKHV